MTHQTNTMPGAASTNYRISPPAKTCNISPVKGVGLIFQISNCGFSPGVGFWVTVHNLTEFERIHDELLEDFNVTANPSTGRIIFVNNHNIANLQIV